MFKITLDTEGEVDPHKDGNKKILANALNLNELLAIKPTDDGTRHMLFASPKFKFEGDIPKTKDVPGAK